LGDDGKAVTAVEVALELREERRAGMVAARIGRGPEPFIGAGGRWRCRGGFNGRR
jgi:hypothetical protein